MIIFCFLQNHENDVCHEGLCRFEGLNLGLVVGSSPLNPTLYHDNEHTRGISLRFRKGHNPSTPLRFFDLLRTIQVQVCELCFQDFLQVFVYNIVISLEKLS